MDDATSPELAHIATLRSIVASLTALSSSLVAARLSSSSPEASPTGGSSTDTEAYLDAAAPYFAVLKAVNRTASGNVVKCKARVGEVRSEVDKAHLGLQNLVYERRHLEKEIKSCREFETEYQNINLHSLEDFRAIMAQTDEPVPSDPHDLMLARLRLELQERKRFEAEKRDLLQRKMKLSKENDEKKTKLDELEKHLNAFVNSAKEIQASMQAQQ